MRLVVFTSGTGYLTLSSVSGNTQILNLSFGNAVLATGGALATGKPGFADQNSTAQGVSRYYDNFTIGVPSAEPIAMYSTQSIEFRHNTTLREDSTGVWAGPPPEYVGGRFFAPPAGGPGRKARVGVIARRMDVEGTLDEFIADSLTVAAFVTPRYLVVPHA
jgi:hypothetical protein